MGRHAEGWKLSWQRGGPGVGTAYVRFTLKGVRFNESTREKDPRRAATRAGEIYAREVGGLNRPRVNSNADLEEAIASWLAEIEGTLDHLTVKSYARMGNRWILSFQTVGSMAHSGQLSSYFSARLKRAIRSTVLAEKSAMSGFFDWCKRNEVLGTAPILPEIKPSQIGVRTGKQRATPVELTREEVAALIQALPVMSSHRGPHAEPVDPTALARLHELAATGASAREVALVLTEEGHQRPRGGPWHHQQVKRVLAGAKEYQRYPVRAFFEFSYETGLRPSTLYEISVPTNWKRGAAYLEIQSSIDKARYGRKVPLSDRARELLEEHAPEAGCVWPRHHYFRFLKKAAAQLGMSASIAPYDFRHGRATHWLEQTGNLPGVAFLLGHKRVTTTNKYIHASRGAGEAVIAASDSGIVESALRKSAAGT